MRVCVKNNVEKFQVGVRLSPTCCDVSRHCFEKEKKKTVVLPDKQTGGYAT